jgi:hypothetical protein
MIDKLDSIKKQLTELATILNAFKSEAVQLRLLEFLIGEQSTNGQPIQALTSKKTPSRATRAPITAARNTNQRRAASGTGAPATLSQLLEGTYFDKARTLNDIIEHCKHNLARTFKANEFSGKLARLVRKGDLTRVKNADNQYEYKRR